MSMNTAPVSDLPLLRRVLGIFTSPRAVFASLRERPRILGALLIVVGVSLAATLLILDVIAQDQAAAIESRPGMTAEQIEAAMKVARVSIPVAAVVMNLVMGLLIAGLYLFLANILLGGSTTYRKMLAAVFHISLVSIPSAIVRVPLILAKGTAQVSLGPAALLPTEGDKGFLYHLLSQFDLFNLWMIGLSIIGVSVVAGVPMKKSAVALCVMWAVLFLIFAPISAKMNPGG